MPSRYTSEQIRALTRAVRENRDLVCPACETPLDRRSVPPRRDVSYVRDRVWLSCPTCGRQVVVDREARG